MTVACFILLLLLLVALFALGGCLKAITRRLNELDDIVGTHKKEIKGLQTQLCNYRDSK